MIAAIIQARLNSTRFPRKVLTELEGKPLIYHVVDRLRWSKRIEKIALATTVNPADDELVEWAYKNDLPCFRGSEEDVLDRYFMASKSLNADMVVRITSDDPFKDPVIIDSVIYLLISGRLDFAYNNKPPSFPEGLDIEVFTFEALERASKESIDPFEREHVTQYFYRNPVKFKQTNHAYKKDLSSLRWTIDTEKDLEMARIVYKELYHEGEIFLFEDILNLLDKKPWISSINNSVKRSAMYLNSNKKTV